MSWTVYILELNDRSYYTGITNNISKRLQKHRLGQGSKYVRGRLPFKLVYTEPAINRSPAARREAEIKKMSRENKKTLIEESKMEYPIKPLFDRVFIKKHEVSRTDSGLHLPETVKGRAVTGRVVAVGPGQRNHLGDYIEPCVKVGDIVFLKEFTGYLIRYKDEEEVFVFNENEIIGVVSEDK